MTETRAARGGRPDRVSKAQWLAKALEELEDGGIAAVRVERLAKALSVAKSGFYWHFDGLNDLHRHMLEFWSREFTGVVTSNPDVLASEPRARLETTMKIVEEDNLARYDLAMRSWAKHDATVCAAVNKVMATRLNFIRRIFAELGFDGDDLDMRARLFACYEMWQAETFSDLSKRRRARLRKLRLDLLIGA
jgi:AcrR family transcriptional regulator